MKPRIVSSGVVVGETFTGEVILYQGNYKLGCVYLKNVPFKMPYNVISIFLPNLHFIPFLLSHGCIVRSVENLNSSDRAFEINKDCHISRVELYKPNKVNRWHSNVVDTVINSLAENETNINLMLANLNDSITLPQI